MNTLEPLFFNPIYKDTIWGREIWCLSSNKNGITYLDNDISLIDLFNNRELKEKIFGTKCNNLDTFPLLIKFIEANDDLSVQVHPDDNYANTYEHDSGKDEVWYVMNCKDNANIIYGLNDKVANKEEIVNNIKDYLNYQSINKGDLVSIKAGTVHALLSNTYVCEIQQNSDITYRIYDWDRGRPLNKEKAMDVINLNNEKRIINCNNIDGNIYSSNKFNIDLVNIENKETLLSNPSSFTIYIVVDGEGIIKTNTFEKKIEKESVFLIPSNLGQYELNGKMKLLKVYL